MVMLVGSGGGVPLDRAEKIGAKSEEMEIAIIRYQEQLYYQEG